MAFLKDVSCDDGEWVRALQLWIGYLLVPDTRQQKLLILHGPKRSGKGTICRTIERILGAHNVCSPTLSSLGTRFGLAPLIGKTAAILPDAHLGYRADAPAIVEVLKSIVGEDSQTVDRKHRDSITTRLRVRFTISVNQLVNLPDASDALTARCIILPLEQSYLGREDLDLDDKLAGEAPGILNWALVGLRDLRQNGRLIQPSRGREVVADLGRMFSPVRAFVEDICLLDGGNEVPIQELYKAWCAWCERHGHKSGSDAVLGTKLRAVHPQIKRARSRAVPGDDNSRRTVYCGVAIDYVALNALLAGEFDQSGPVWP